LNKLQLDQIRDERREQIKQAALKIFARHGFAGTKTSMIATEAGISEGLIYRYFKSKDELFTTIVRELMEVAQKETQNVAYLPGSPFEQIKAFTASMLDKDVKYPFMLILRIRKEEGLPHEVTKILTENSFNVVIERLVPVFIKGQQAGEFCEGDPRKLLGWYLYIVNFLIVEEAEQEDYGFPDLDFLMRMLAK
jgi:AcrR family transcriptional regulator